MTTTITGSRSETDRFVEDLLGRMTLAEKVGQLNHPNAYGADTTGGAAKVDIEDRIRQGQVGSIAGSGDLSFMRALQETAIRESPRGIPLLFTLDVIHGHRTIFPLPLGLACSWNTDLIRRTARVAAVEASAAGICLVWAPMLDVTYDARWGRCAESPGEDPYLAACFATAMVEGLQDEDPLSGDTVMATAKHFAGYGMSEGGRDYNAVDISAYRLHNVVLPPFKAAVQAGVGAVMVGFNALSGIPVSAHHELLQRLLREQWGFDGLLVSDYTAIMELVNHGVACDLKDAARYAFKAGITIDLVSEAYVRHLGELVVDGEIAEADVDAACRRVLAAKCRLGLFADPFRYLNAERRRAMTLTPAHRQLAREAAAKSCVLLKNGGNILPLEEQGLTIALVGPLADSRGNMQGTWAVSAQPEDSVTILEGLQAAAGAGTTILHAKGANIVDDPNVAARLNLFGETATIDERGPETLIAEAVNIASKADVIVACVGEAKEHAGESSTRTDIGLPGRQRALLESLLDTGKPLVLVAMSGRPLALEWESRHAAAILHVWFAGTEAGNAIADILFGKCNPSGKLAMAFPRTAGQCPMTYAEPPTGRPIDGVGVDAPGDEELDRCGRRAFRKFTTACRLEGPHSPLFPFGYGLSYSTFAYGPVHVSKTKLQRRSETLVASVSIRNEGSVTGEEIVQLYVNDPVASRSRPMRELKGFKRVLLRPGEEKTVSFRIGMADLSFFRAPSLLNAEPTWEPGEFMIQIGPDSENLRSASVRWHDDPADPSALS